MALRLLLEPNQVRGVNLVREFRTAADAGAPHSETTSWTVRSRGATSLVLRRSAAPATLEYVELRAALLVAVLALALPSIAAAHVQLSPNRVAPAEFTLFTVLSPNESAQPLTGLQLVIPEGLQVDSVADTPGFATRIIEDEQHRIAGLSWQGGRVGSARLALFHFSGIAGGDGTLQLTGIQRFADGSTKVWHSPTVTVAAAESSSQRDSLTLGLAVAALVLAGLAGGGLVYLLTRRRRVAI
jgi:uncharacterized protein YcnI